LIFAAALNSNQNPFFEIGSSLIVTQKLDSGLRRSDDFLRTCQENEPNKTPSLREETHSVLL